MNVQQYIADKYRKHLEETVGKGYDAKNPVDFMSEFNHKELADEEWFADPIYNAYEETAYKLFGDKYDEILCANIENEALFSLLSVDLGHLYDIASDYADERNGERR